MRNKALANKTVAEPVRRNMAFLIMVGSSQQENEAAMLIDSIHDFGGMCKDCEIYVVQTDPQHASGKSLEKYGVSFVPLEMNERFRHYLFADKVYACAQVEAMLAGKVEELVWMNPGCLVLNPPIELKLNPSQAAAVRPVHIRNVGLAADEPVNEYWSTVFETCGLDPDRAFTVESFVDGQRIRAYFNSGTMAVRPERKIFQVWRTKFEKLLLNKAFQDTIAKNKPYRLFLHQVVFSVVLVAMLKRSETKMLPPEYGYPLHLHDELPFDRKAESLNALTTVIYEGYFRDPGWASDIAIREPLGTWLSSRLAKRT